MTLAPVHTNTSLRLTERNGTYVMDDFDIYKSTSQVRGWREHKPFVNVVPELNTCHYLILQEYCNANLKDMPMGATCKLFHSSMELASKYISMFSLIC